MNKRVFVVGDIHGRLIALNEVLDKSGFDNDKDRLIPLGDVCDGGSQTKGVINRLLEIKDRIDILGNHDCLTTDAKALTHRGWLSYNDITTGDEVYSFDTENGIGVWMPVTRVIVKDHDGDMITVDTNRARMKITPTHRVLCTRGTTVGGVRLWSDYQYIRASELSSRIRIPVCASDDNPEFDISDDEIRLTAWILTDGCIEKKHGYISVSQSKPEGCGKIQDVLDRLGYTYSIIFRTRNIKSICGKNLVKSPLPEVRFGVCALDSRKIHKYVRTKDKIPWWVFEISDRQFKIFLNTLVDGDGSRYNHGDNPFILYGTERFLCEVQSVCVTKGYSATITESNRKDFRLNICNKRTIEFDCYNTVSSESYNGKVWCIETPLTNFMVSYKGTCYFTGNSWFRTWAIPSPDGDDFQYIRTKSLWEPQGGIWTQKSYDNSPFAVPQSHRDFLMNQVPYYIDEKNRIFVHGGFNAHKPIEVQSTHDIMWDRKLLTYAKYRHVRGYKHVFVGHTSTQIFKENQVPITHPITHHNLTMCDCGAGWTGRLALVNVDNPKEFWLSGFQEPNFEPGENDGTNDTEEEAWNSLTSRGLLAK